MKESDLELLGKRAKDRDLREGELLSKAKKLGFTKREITVLARLYIEKEQENAHT